MDVLEIDAASNNGVDNVRILRDDAIYTPSEVKKRVYIIDEVHMLSTVGLQRAAQNSSKSRRSTCSSFSPRPSCTRYPQLFCPAVSGFPSGAFLPEDIAGLINYVAYQERIELDAGRGAAARPPGGRSAARRHEPA
jgi:DNA polymerase-3 subunit gamma/tau